MSHQQETSPSKTPVILGMWIAVMSVLRTWWGQGLIPPSTVQLPGLSKPKVRTNRKCQHKYRSYWQSGFLYGMWRGGKECRRGGLWQRAITKQRKKNMPERESTNLISKETQRPFLLTVISATISTRTYRTETQCNKCMSHIKLKEKN